MGSVFSLSAPLIKSALTIAGEGLCPHMVFEKSYTSVTAPAVAGQDMEVPLAEVHELPPSVGGTKGILFGGRAAAETTWAPEATTSGFVRPSAVGPRLEKPAIEELATPFLSFPVAPTVMMFLALAGEPIERSPPPPELPAEKQNTSGWAPGVMPSASRTMVSYATSLVV